jgi:hypothetical protein
MPNPAARRGSIANYAFPELHPKVNRKYKYAYFSLAFKPCISILYIPCPGKQFLPRPFKTQLFELKD